MKYFKLIKRRKKPFGEHIPFPFLMVSHVKWLAPYNMITKKNSGQLIPKWSVTSFRSYFSTPLCLSYLEVGQIFPSVGLSLSRPQTNRTIRPAAGVAIIGKRLLKNTETIIIPSIGNVQYLLNLCQLPPPQFLYIN